MVLEYLPGKNLLQVPRKNKNIKLKYLIFVLTIASSFIGIILNVMRVLKDGIGVNGSSRAVNKNLFK